MTVDLPEYLSPSSAASFDGCPKRWRFKYIDRLPEPPSEPALVGNFAHEVLEHLCDLPDTERTVEQAKKLAAAIWPDFALSRNFDELALDDDAKRAFRWKAWLAIAGLWDLEDPSSIDVVATEQKVSVELGGVPFLGIVDRVERDGTKLVVSDYKSGSLPKARFRDDKIQQVMLYAAALEAMDGEQPDRVQLLYLGQQTVATAVTDRKVTAAVEQLATTWAGLTTACETDEFTAKTAVLCGWCPFAEHCDEGIAYLQSRYDKGNLPAHAPAIALLNTTNS